MKKIKNFFKKNYIYILAFFIPIVIFVISLTFAKFRPFGPNTISIYDGYHQYPGIAAYYSRVLRGTESLLYSFKGGLGTNFYAIAIYYLFNPTSLFLFFFNSNNLSIYYEFVIILKIGLCGLSMSFLLKYLKRTNLSIVLFSIAYALCSYNLIYFSNCMWIDSLFLFPIVILGLNKLIYEKKKFLYLFMLTFSIISNFYIGYMICIFSLLYFIYNYILIPKKERKNLIKDFLILSLCAGLISCFVLLPVTLELFMGKSELYKSNFTKYFVFDLDFISTFYKLTIGSSGVKDVSYGTPNIYCSILVLVSVIFSFFSKSFNKKEKILNAIIIFYFILSFTFNLFDYSWQLFQRPIWYPVRYAFTFVLFLILIASKCFDNRKTVKISILWKSLTLFFLTGLIIIGFCLACDKAITFDIKAISLILSIILLLEYFFIYKINNKIVNIFLISIFMLEIVFNSICTLKILSSSTTYDYEKITLENYNRLYKKIENNTTGFYRMEFNKKHNFNNGFLFNYNGINFFSSIRNNNVINFLDYYNDVKVSDGCSVTYNFYNPILNNILGIKYLAASNNAMYYDVAFDNNSSIYENKDAFSLGYIVDDDIYNVNLEKMEYDENIEKIVNGFMGYDLNLYQELEGTIENAKIINNKTYQLIDSNKSGYLTYKASGKGFYILKTSSQPIIHKIYINGTQLENEKSLVSSVFIKDNENLELTFRLFNGLNINRTKLIYIPYDKYLEFVQYIKQNEMIITNYKNDSYLEAKVNAGIERNTLFTTIPYDEGWSIYVDGEKFKYESTLNNAFITFKLNPGEHNIIFKYFPRGLKLGIIISSIGIILSTIYLYFTKKSVNK